MFPIEQAVIFQVLGFLMLYQNANSRRTSRDLEFIAFCQSYIFNELTYFLRLYACFWCLTIFSFAWGGICSIANTLCKEGKNRVGSTAAPILVFFKNVFSLVKEKRNTLFLKRICIKRQIYIWK